MGMVYLSSSMSKICSVVVDCRFSLSWYRWSRVVTMEGGNKQRMLGVLRPGHVRKFPYLQNVRILLVSG